jgi:catalase
MHNNQRDGHMRQEIAVGRVSYHPNSLGGGCPFQAKIEEGGFASFNERVDAQKVRDRSASFSDHFSQATLFYQSQTETEQAHIINALCFELGKVATVAIRERMLGLLCKVDKILVSKVAKGLGLKVPKDLETPINQGVGADADTTKYEPKEVKPIPDTSDALSMLKIERDTNIIATRQIAFLCADGVNAVSIANMRTFLENGGAVVKIIAPHLGVIISEEGTEIPVDQSYLTAASVLFDAVFVPAGKGILDIKNKNEVKEFLTDSYKHCKFIAVEGEGIETLSFAHNDKISRDVGVLISDQIGDENFAASFAAAIAKHRFWEREANL